MRGGRLNDSRFGVRMSGEGNAAVMIAQIFRGACRRAGLNLASLAGHSGGLSPAPAAGRPAHTLLNNRHLDCGIGAQSLSQVAWLEGLCGLFARCANCGWPNCRFLLKFLHLSFDTICRASVTSRRLHIGQVRRNHRLTAQSFAVLSFVEGALASLVRVGRPAAARREGSVTAREILHATCLVLRILSASAAGSRPGWRIGRDGHGLPSELLLLWRRVRTRHRGAEHACGPVRSAMCRTRSSKVEPRWRMDQVARRS